MVEEKQTVERKKAFKIRISKAFFVIIFLLILSFPVWLTKDYIEFSKVGVNSVFQLLGLLFVIALFLERSLDVFLTTWRSSDSEELTHSIEKLQKEVNEEEKLKSPGSPDSENLKGLRDQLYEEERKKLMYSAKTRVIAMWSGLLFGILLSAVGVRTLGSFVDPAQLNALKGGQQIIFKLADILLTGGLIAGGSDGIHKITDFYRNFMEKSTKKVQQDSK